MICKMFAQNPDLLRIAFPWIHFALARELEEKMYAEKQAAIGSHRALQFNQKNAMSLSLPASGKQAQPNAFLQLLPEAPKPSQFEHVNIAGFDIVGQSQTLPKPNSRLNQPSNTNGYSVELQHELLEIEQKYAPEILSNIEIYKKFRVQAEDLGIVFKFPIEFFQKQAESIKQFKEKGGY